MVPPMSGENALFRPALSANGQPDARQLWRANRATGASEGVYRDLKRRILRLDLAPGEALSEPHLAQQYDLSRTPIREALIRLSDEGLVEIVPKSGTTVARIPLALLPEAIFVRLALEEATCRQAALHATDSAVLRLEACVALQREVARQPDTEAFHLADEQFHATLADVAGFPGIWTLVERAKMHIDRYRRLTLPQHGRMPMVIDQHLAIVEAIRKRDPEGAGVAMRRHLEGLAISIEAVRSSNPDFFAEAP